MPRVSSPTHLGRYPVLRRLGSGAFASVWLARDEALDSEVAIKVLADNWAADEHVRRRFIEEGRFLRKVSSPHVVAVHDAGELPDSRPFLVMEFADAGTLADVVASGREFTPEAVIGLIEQVGSGLSALHAKEVLHRDVKPSNVLLRLDDDGAPRAMLGDLGLGKTIDASSRLTMISGTPAYAAPEQARGERLDQRADLYSLAAIAHLLLVGRPPHDHSNLTATAQGLAPQPMNLHPRVEAVLAQGLDPDSARRQGDVAEFVSQLRDALGALGGDDELQLAGHTQVLRREEAAEERRTTFAGAVWFVVGLILLALTGLLIGIAAERATHHLSSHSADRTPSVTVVNSSISPARSASLPVTET